VEGSALINLGQEEKGEGNRAKPRRRRKNGEKGTFGKRRGENYLSSERLVHFMTTDLRQGNGGAPYRIQEQTSRTEEEREREVVGKSLSRSAQVPGCPGARSIQIRGAEEP